MAFGYPNPYQPTPYPNYYTPPMPDQLSQLRMNQYQQPTTPAQPAPQASNGSITWVQGEEGAKAFMVAPGNTVLLMDSDGCSFYLKSADASGMPQPLRIFDYVERTSASKGTATVPTPEYVTREEFNALSDKVNAITKAEEV